MLSFLSCCRTFTNGICPGFFFWFLTSFRCFSITSVKTRSTWLCRQVYICISYDKPMVHAEKMFSLYFHTGYSLVYVSDFMREVVGVGNTSYTDIRRDWSCNCGYCSHYCPCVLVCILIVTALDSDHFTSTPVGLTLSSFEYLRVMVSFAFPTFHNNLCK